MSQNINSLKMGFINYLQEKNEKEDKEYTTSNTDASIFLYADEFKDYLSDEFDIDSKVLAMSINDILDMEIKDGKLIDPNDNQFNNEQINTDQSFSFDITDSSTNFDKEAANKNFISGFLNTLFEDNFIKNIIDTDKNKELNSDEINSFINTIKNYDGNDENISIEDILLALEEMNDGTFNIDNENTEYQNQNAALSNIDWPITNSNSTGTSTVNSIGNLTGTSTGTLSGSSTTNSPTSTGETLNTPGQGVQEKSLDNMTKEELNSELSTAQTDLANKESTLSSILDGSNPEIAKLQENIDKSYNIYQEKLKEVDEVLAKQVDNLKKDIDSKENELDAKEQEISDQESTVNESKNKYNNAVSTRKNLENSLSALKSIDKSKMDSNKLAQLNNKISDLESKVEKAKKTEEDAKKAWDDAEDKLKQLKKEKDTIQKELDDLNEQMKLLEQEIAEKYPQVEEYLKAYNNAKKEYDNYKQEAISSAKSGIQESQEYVNKIQTAINNYTDKETIEEYCFEDFGDEIIDFAEQFIGYNEENGSADIFLYGGYTSDTTPWCAAFVEYIMKNSGNYENVPDWYKDIENKWWCPNIYQAANNAGAIIEPEEAKPGDIILFYREEKGTYGHVGIIKSVEDGKVITIEGNTSNQVAERTYDINNEDLVFCQVVS